MEKKKAIRLGGFVGALCASATLVGLSVSGTGAYFTDSHDGNLAGTSGHLNVNTSSLNLNYTGLIPDEDQTRTITYTPSDGSPNEDVWMVFDTGSSAYGQFTGANHVNYGGYSSGGLGGYGHFKIASNQGFGFESYNLQLPSATSNPCANSNGDGGSNQRASGPDNGSQSAPECGVPGEILIGHDIPANVQGSAVVTFGLTGKAQAQNTVFANVPFKIVATQVGHKPDDANF